jgi:hypothetical protein
MHLPFEPSPAHGQAPHAPAYRPTPEDLYELIRGQIEAVERAKLALKKEMARLEALLVARG